jgi:D-3-phosphoglycerate dehydrogenase
MATGFDCVDVEYATDQGIVVCNAGAYCSHEVADHAMTLLLCLSRRIAGLHSAVLSGTWKSSACGTAGDLRKQTLGIVGLGRIGSRVALRAQAFGLRVVAYDSYVDRSRMDLLNVEKVTFESLVEDSDYVSLHCPLTDETRGIIDGSVLAAMRPSAFLINTGRGECVDTSALVDALERGNIAGAGLDVVCPEPIPASHRLCSLPNVLITPHAAFRSTSSVLELRRRPCQQVVMALKDEPPDLIVNPEVLGRTNCRVKCSSGSRQTGLRS